MNQPAAPPSAPSAACHAGQGTPAIAARRTGHLKGVLCCLAATVSFGLMFPVMAGALARVDPFTFTALRYLVAGTASLALLRWREGPGALRLGGERVALAWLLGSVGFAGFGFLVFLGQQLAGRDGALTASIMAATQPMLGVLILSAARRALPPLHTVLCVALSFCGVALVVTKGDLGSLLREPQHHWANALIVLGMACWLVYTFGAARFAAWSALRYTTLTMWLGLPTIVAIDLSLMAAGAIPVPGAADLAAVVPHLLYMGLVASLFGVLCWNLGNRLLTPLNAVLFMDVVPVTAFAASSLAGVVPTRLQVAGACVTGTALILNNLWSRLRIRRPQPSTTGRATGAAGPQRHQTTKPAATGANR